MSTTHPELVSGQTIPVPLTERVTTWIKDHKLLISLGIVVIGGTAYYYRPREKPKKKKKERKEKESVKEKEREKDKIDIIELKDEELSPTQKKERADELKKLGNAAYSKKDYADAIDLYSRAIDTYPDHVYYSNRAACYAAQTDYEKVIADTTQALRIEPTYVKALNRRALAYETTGRHQEALLDYTASSIMDNFQNEAAAGAIERLLKKIAEIKCKEMLAERSDRMPSYSFISAYLDAFRPRTPPELEANDALGDSDLKKALDATESKQYKEAIEHLEVAKSKSFSSDIIHSLCLNLSATYKFVKADVAAALSEIDEAIKLNPTTNSYVKRASMHMESGDKDSTMIDFQKAIDLNGQDPDIYYHRGQCNFILQEFTAAARDYQKSIDIDPSFAFSHIQLGVAQYKLGSTSASMSTFRRCLQRFPESAEVYNYYGELLLDQGKFEEAIEKFDHAIQIERSAADGHKNVMPLINKALAVFQWRKDMAQAEDLCRKALLLDAESDVALATLSQFLLTQGKAKDALQYFQRSAEVARTEAEIINALSYAEATRTQLEVERKYPDLAQKMAALAAAASRQV